VALELINEICPLFKLMVNELILFGFGGLAESLITYSSPCGREDELPQLSKNALRAHRPTVPTIPTVLFNAYSPGNGPIFRFLASSRNC